MKSMRMARRALLISSIFAAVLAPASAQDSSKDGAQAIAEVKAVMANIEKTKGRLQDLYWDQSINIHGSGWIYTKADGWGPGDAYEDESSNLRNHVIKSVRTQYQILSPNRDTVIESWQSATYYEVPDPEERARAAGTLSHYDAKARAAANRKALDNALPPGMGPSENPYRNRSTRVWSRINGKWAITASVGSRVGERVVAGRFNRF